MRNGFGWWRLAKQVVLGAAEAVASFANTTFTNNDWDLTADGVDDATLTLTLRDTTGALMTGRAVTFAVETVTIGAATCTVETDAAEIETTSGTANITAHVYDEDGTPLPGIPAASLTLASTGSSNTITAVDTVTDRNGRFRWTFSSTSAATKTLSLTACGLAITDTAQVVVSAAPSAPTPLASNSWPATGSTANNKLGSTGVTPFENQVGSPPLVSLSVVEKSAEATAESIPGLNDVPFDNWLRTDLTYVGGSVQNMATEEIAFAPGSTAWPIPGVGEALYFRIYKLFHYPSVSDPPALGNGNHPLEQYAGGGNSWSWTMTSGSGGFNPVFNVWVGGAATRFFLGGGSPIYLTRDVPWRLEWSVERTGTNTREHNIRIYDADGVLQYDTSDFATSGSVSLVGYSAAFGSNGVNALDAFQVGTNGPHVPGATVGAAPAWYWGAWAVGDTWLGVWSTGQ